MTQGFLPFDNETLARAYDEGREARESGIAPIANRYPVGSEERAAWADGWLKPGAYFLRKDTIEHGDRNESTGA